MKTGQMKFAVILVVCGMGGFTSAQSLLHAEDISNQDLFQQLDQNRDGVLNKSELNEGQLVYFERLLRRSDENKDGKLTAAEMSLGLKEPDPSMNLEVASGPGGGRGDFNPGQMFEFMDRNQDGKLSRSELPEMAKERLGKVLDFLDKEEVTKEEYMQIMQRMMGPGMPPNGMAGQMPRPAPEQLALMLERMDQNSDGKISPNEVPERAKPMIVQMQRRLGLKDGDAVSIKEIKDNVAAEGEMMRPGVMKREMSKDPKSETEKSEMKPALSAEYSNKGKERPAIEPENSKVKGQEGILLKQMDKNGDGSISRDEAPERMKQFFDRIDQNSDGKLSGDELSKAREQREKK